MNYSGTNSDGYSEDDFSEECRRRLGYHPVQTEAQRLHFENNRQLFMMLWDHLNSTYEPSRELSLALTALQDSLMWANAHVACNDVGVEPVDQ